MKLKNSDPGETDLLYTVHELAAVDNDILDTL